jgi:hypothetical protein
LSAMQSFTEPPGCFPSSFPTILAIAPSACMMWFISTSGVQPISCKM